MEKIEKQNRIRSGSWRHWLIYRTTTYRTTWRLRLGLLALFLLLLTATKGWWIPAMGWGLVVDSQSCRPDLILIDNLEQDYLLFEKASEPRKGDNAPLVLVPVTASGRDPQKPGLVPLGVAEVMLKTIG